MFQFAKFEKSKECRLATELEYGFPIGDPWIKDGISPWPFASESVLPSQCRGIHPMHSFQSCTRLLLNLTFRFATLNHQLKEVTFSFKDLWHRGPGQPGRDQDYGITIISLHKKVTEFS
ncbi:hypothetical protein F511_22331 [Dorcoceras hygrometricum]|uniref:Uncharacterized protein n=1 Tax=Dorcoceras hygrometricum TaxID=472368 RepID=A0A2Z7A7K8_9LAMI|nr:hypothetical protein F511_22331 [Dorcoceras hygrometricum]